MTVFAYVNTSKQVGDPSTEAKGAQPAGRAGGLKTKK